MGTSLQTGEPSMDTNTTDWRTQFSADSRHKIVNKIMETLKKHLPFSSPEAVNEVRGIATRFEEHIFSCAVDQSDYLRIISTKMLTMETIPAAYNSTYIISRHLMDNNNWRPSLPNGEPAMDTDDWKTQLPPDSREKIVNKIMETLKKHLPFSGPEGINELMRIATRFEEKIFSGAVSQTDYLRKISMKMLTMETKSQNGAGSSSSIPAANNGTSMGSIVSTNQGHLLPGTLPTNQSQPPQPLLPSNHVDTSFVAFKQHLMDFNNWRPSLPNGEPAIDTGDWRTQLPPDSREKIINKIIETLKKHLPFAGPEGINELRRIAARFEKIIFSGAISQTDYLRKISMKMLTMETKSQNAASSSSSTPAANNSLPLDLGYLMDNENS